VEAEVGL
jgi:hypothetical protein